MITHVFVVNILLALTITVVGCTADKSGETSLLPENDSDNDAVKIVTTAEQVTLMSKCCGDTIVCDIDPRYVLFLKDATVITGNRQLVRIVDGKFAMAIHSPAKTLASKADQAVGKKFVFKISKTANGRFHVETLSD